MEGHASRSPYDLMNGLLVLDKPSGITSRRAVDCVARIAGRGVRVGHAGTLDPLATGVLVVALGSATRLIEYVQRLGKTYRTSITLGATSDTDDADGTITPLADATDPGEDALRVAASRLVGEVLQVPPLHSAVHVDGRRAYSVARAGETPELKPRPVRIDRIEITRYEWPRAELEVTCGSGTYIRSIARDLGQSLGVGAYVETLSRTRIGRFILEEAVPLAQIEAEGRLPPLRPALEALSDLPTAHLTEEQVQLIRQGRSLDAKRIRLDSSASGLEWVLLDTEGGLVGLGSLDEASGSLRPRKVFAVVP
jgi:tRNA pseudouridine55 synthase